MDIRQESLAKHYEWAGKIEVTARTHAKSRKELSPCVHSPALPSLAW